MTNGYHRRGFRPRSLNEVPRAHETYTKSGDFLMDVGDENYDAILGKGACDKSGKIVTLSSLRRLALS